MNEPADAAFHHVDNKDAAFVGVIPEHYHRGIGSFLFEPYAQETAARVAAFAPRRLLETACGTGIVTRRLRDALTSETRLVATDLNEPMLAVAKRTVGERAAVTWELADMTRLPFGDGQFDAVVCQFGLMFVPDKPAAMREARRVLGHGGRLFVATWGSLERNPVVRAAHETVGAFFPDAPPQFYLTPFGYGDPDQLKRLLVDAGFVDVRVEIVQKATTSSSAREVAIGLIEGYPIADYIRASDPALLPVVVDAVTKAIGERFGDAPVKTTLEALVASGDTPSDQ
ncbi:class I SAM-dependent methyltransferase [Sorangium sp. So ce1128]